MNENISALYNSILEGDVTGAKESIQAALDAGLEPGQILADGMIAAMKEVGKRFEEGSCYIPEMLIAARTMQAGLSLLKPYLAQSNVKSTGKVVIGTVKGDLHDIGKNLVAMMLEGAGYEIIDLGVDVPAEAFVEAAKNFQPDIIAMSALLTTTMLSMKTTIDAITAAGLRSRIQVIVGGAPVTEAYAQQIEADGFAPDASQAVSLAQSLMGLL
jgi:5-methyltetrahydrofolate--homocysteine methyltransferase